MERVCIDPGFRLWVAWSKLRGGPLDDAGILKFLDSPSHPSPDVSYLVGDPMLADILGSKGVHTSMRADRVKEAWYDAGKLLRALHLQHLLGLTRAVDMVAGLDGPYGEVRALSNPCFPGFVAIGINGPPLIIAEQAVHEAVHVVLAAHLSLDEGLAGLLDERVGILSPFTNSVRTIERVAHGIVSYAAVAALWQAAAEYPALASLLGLSDRDQARRTARRRVEAVGARLRVVTQCLHDGAGSDACGTTVQLVRDLVGYDAPFLRPGGSRRELVAQAGYTTEDLGFSPLQRAELAMAVAGQKVSRVSLRGSEVQQVGFALLSRLAIACSSWAVRPVPDPKIGGFSNISGRSKHILEAGSDDEVHLYLHPDAAAARDAALLDGDEQAGELLGIPECCRDWFARTWPTIRIKGGDLFASMLRGSQSRGRIIIERGCDALAMYRGEGLCWHFPCSPDCAETVRTVNERRALLSTIDAGLLAELDRADRDVVTLLPDGRYHDGISDLDGAVVVLFR